MPNYPTHESLIEEYRVEVQSDPDTNLVKFDPGTVNRGFAGIAATAALGVYRWSSRLLAGAFVQTAKGSALDYVIADRLGDQLPRLPGESNEDYRARFFAFVGAMGKGTRKAWEYYRDNIVDKASPSGSTVGENLEEGQPSISLALADGATEAELTQQVEDTVGEWRILGLPLDLTIIT